MSLCDTVCFAVIPLLLPDIGQNVYIHQYMYFSLPDSPCVVHPITILIWKDGFFCVVLGACSSHSTCGPTTWLQCVHASVHEFMSHWLSMSAPSLWKHLWKHGDPSVALQICHLHYFSWHILVRMCTCISTCTSVYLTPHICFIPLVYLHWYMGSSLCHCVCHPVIYFWYHTLFKMCTCISTLIYVLTWLCISAPSHLNSFMKTWVPLCGIVCLSQSTYFW